MANPGASSEPEVAPPEAFPMPGGSLIRDLSLSLKHTSEVKSAVALLARLCPRPTRHALGICELLMNAIEHGSLEIDGAEKARLVGLGQLDEEIERRQRDPQYAAREVLVSLRHFDDHVELVCEDQGPGFDWRALPAELEADPVHLNGRGVGLARSVSFDSVEYLGRGNVVVARARKQRRASHEGALRPLSAWETRALDRQAERVLEGVLDDDFFQAVLDLCLSTSESPHGFLGYLDTAGDLQLATYRDGRPGIRGLPITLQRGAWSDVWGEVLLDQATRVKNRTHALPLNDLRLARSMGTPIVHRGRLIGSVHVGNRERPYDVCDAQRLEAVVRHLTRAIGLTAQVALAKTAQLRMEAQQASFDEEQAMALHLMRSLLREGCLDAPGIRHHLSSKELFNGDMALAARLPGGGLRLMLGDFVGHGLPAAIGGLPLASAFYATARKGVPLAEVIGTMNDSLFTLLQRGHFCGAVLLDLDYDSGRLLVWNGGMPAALLLSGSKEIRELPSRHLPLGTVPSSELEVEVSGYDVQPGDVVLCFSDGVPETRNLSGELFGMDRVKQILSKNAPSDGFEGLLRALEAFRGIEQSADDVSLVAVTVAAGGSAPL